MTWFKLAFWIQVQDPNPSRFGKFLNADPYLKLLFL